MIRRLPMSNVTNIVPFRTISMTAFTALGDSRSVGLTKFPAALLMTTLGRPPRSSMTLDTASRTEWGSRTSQPNATTCVTHKSIKVTSHEHHHISNHWQYDFLFSSLFRLTTKKPPKLHITGNLCWIFSKKHKVYLHFLSFFKAELASILEILSHKA